LAAQLSSTRAELTALQKRYDALRADRDRLARTLGEKEKIYKRFKQWILLIKGKVPPKAAHFTDVGVKRVGKSTPTSQQQFAVKMLETPITPMSLSTYLLSDARLSILSRHPELRSTVPAAQPSPTKSVSPRRSPLSPNKHILNTPRCVLRPPSFHPARYLTQ